MKRDYPLVLSIASGKGGVGKTSLSVNLAYSLSKMNKKVVLFDADLGLANVDVMLGISPKLTLFHLFNENADINEVLFPTGYGFDILPASSGVSDMVNLSKGQKLDLLDSMDYLDENIDYLIIDTGAGINDNVLYFNIAVQERMLVLTPDPTSLTDCYALIKVLKLDHGVEKFHIVVNSAPDEKIAKETFTRLYNVCDKFLSGISLSYAGSVPFDTNMKQAIINQKPVCHWAPNSKSALALTDLAKKISRWNTSTQLDGNIKFFWKKLLFHES